MEFLTPLLQFVLHPDQQLGVLLHEYGTWVYAILFAVLFCETGLVFTPFLPGDSLLCLSRALWSAAGTSRQGTKVAATRANRGLRRTPARRRRRAMRASGRGSRRRQSRARVGARCRPSRDTAARPRATDRPPVAHRAHRSPR